jgi:hypothetical protein
VAFLSVIASSAATKQSIECYTRIRVITSDDIEVVAVEIAIHTSAGVRLEHGDAAQVHGVWCYRTSSSEPAGEPLVVTAVARDRPGHEGRQTRLCL